MSPLETGRELAHYRIERRLGAGGMGEVYQAFDTRLQRYVAVKVLPAATVADPIARRRLLEEARAAAALTHPHVVTIYAVEESGSDVFLVMEYAEGKSLKERLEEGPLDIEELVRLGIHVSDALAAAHAIGIIHRDIKPANILLTGSGGAKVLDFGIAERIAAPSTETVAQTMTRMAGDGMVVGTVAYMAPEQARGETLDGRADVFSLGATLYEAATGRQAFEGATALDTMIAVVTKEPPQPSVVRSEIPPDFDRILSRALAKTRDERYASARELADALRGLQKGTESHSGTVPALSAAPSKIPNNLPAPLTSFVGRSRERGELRRLLGSSRLLTILGPGGSGKTRLAIQFAREILEDYPDGIWIAELETLPDGSLVPQQVARAVGVQEEPGTPVTKTLAASLASKSLLLILDNCEHVAAAVAGLLTAVLGSAPRVRVVTTSREALGVPGEMIWRIPMLSVPDPRTSVIRSREAAGRYDAVRLFVDRAQAAQPAFQLTDKNAEAVAQICHRLDGIPLAVELAAVRVKLLPVEQILARLQDRFALLTGGSRTALPRQQTLRAAMDWSYDLLSDAEKKLLNRVSVFSGGFTIDAAEEVCVWNGLDRYEVLDLLAPLIDKSLVVQGESAEGFRYWLLETIRDYGAECLSRAGESSTQEDRHALYYFKLVLQAEPQLQGREQAAWFQILDEEQDNIRRAIRYYRLRGDAAGAYFMSEAIWRWWWVRGLWEEGRNVLRQTLAMPTGLDPTVERAKALYASAVLARGQGDVATAYNLLSESLDIARSLDDRVGVASALFELGNLANTRSDLDTAARYYAEALEIRREIGDRRGVSMALHNLAVVAGARGDSEESGRLFAEALELHRELGNAAMEASTLNGLSDAALHLGELDAAQSYLERGLAIQRDLGDRDGAGFSLRLLGEIAVRRGDAPQAKALMAESYEIFQSIGDTSGLLDLMDGAAGLASLMGDAEKAILFDGAGTAWRMKIDVPRAEPDQIELNRRLEKARADLGETGASVEARGSRLSSSEALSLLADFLKA